MAKNKQVGWKSIFSFYLTEPNTHDTAPPPPHFLSQGWTMLRVVAMVMLTHHRTGKSSFRWSCRWPTQDIRPLFHEDMRFCTFFAHSDQNKWMEGLAVLSSCFISVTPQRSFVLYPVGNVVRMIGLRWTNWIWSVALWEMYETNV
jgi:hypothetical protein